MNYFISFIGRDGFEWELIETTDFDFISRVFEEMAPPPEYAAELRMTEEPVDTCLSWEVVRYDYNNFDPTGV